MIEPDTDIGTEYEYFQVHKARYLETLRIFNPKPQMEVLDVGTIPGHLALAMKFLGCKVMGTDKDFADKKLYKIHSDESHAIMRNRLTKHGIPIKELNLVRFSYYQGTYQVYVRS